MTVAKAITLKDKFENLGDWYVLLHPFRNSIFILVQDVVSKTNEVAGDGTTSATVLTRAEGIKNVAAGRNPMDLRRGFQATINRTVEFLSTPTRMIATTGEIAQIAT